MKNSTLHTTVHERFPEYSEQISQLLREDANFEELCSDYEELADWLADHSHDDCTPESACVRNRQLLAELEVDILEALQVPERPSTDRADQIVG